MSTWIKVEKLFQGGRREVILFDPEDLDKEEIAGLAKDWGESSSGGHNYGYTINWERTKPTEADLNSQIRVEKADIARYEKRIPIILKRIELLEKEKNDVCRDSSIG